MRNVSSGIRTDDRRRIMRIRHTVTWLAVVGAIAIGASSAAAGNVPRTGEKLSFSCAIIGAPCTETSLPANEPFFVAHGHNIVDITMTDLLDPDLRFELSVDGEQAHGVVNLDLNAEVPTKTYIFNFRFGMTGTHTFTGCWHGTDGSPLFCGTRVVHFV
jgi:hypothetical protein